MKRFGVLLLLFSLLGACSSAKTIQNTEESEEIEDSIEKEEEKGMEVQKGLVNVEITLPPIFFEDEDIDEVIENAKADGIKDITKNADGSLTYKMSRAKHKEMLNEMKESIAEQVEELETGEDFLSIKAVNYKKGFKEFTLQVDRESYENSFDGFAILGLGFAGTLYQVFEGSDIEGAKVIIHLEDASTSDIFDSVVFPDALEE